MSWLRVSILILTFTIIGCTQTNTPAGVANTALTANSILTSSDPAAKSFQFVFTQVSALAEQAGLIENRIYQQPPCKAGDQLEESLQRALEGVVDVAEDGLVIIGNVVTDAPEGIETLSRLIGREEFSSEEILTLGHQILDFSNQILNVGDEAVWVAHCLVQIGEDAFGELPMIFFRRTVNGFRSQIRNARFILLGLETLLQTIERQLTHSTASSQTNSPTNISTNGFSCPMAVSHIQTNNGLQMRLRSGPSTSYNIYGLLGKETCYAVQEISQPWAHISTINGDGWVYLPSVSLTIIEPTLVPTPVVLSNIVLFDDFNNGINMWWLESEGWTTVPSENGLVAQIVSSDHPLLMPNQSLRNLVVEARFLIGNGTARLSSQVSAAGDYTVLLEPDGRLVLYRGYFSMNLLFETQIANFDSNIWHTLRLSNIIDQITVSVDGNELINVKDSVPLIPGNILIGGYNTQGALQLDDFKLYAP